MRRVFGLTLFVAAILAHPALAMTWAQADGNCHALGNGCCAVADDDGNPKMRNGVNVCSCALVAHPGPLTLLERKALGNRSDVKLATQALSMSHASAIPHGQMQQTGDMPK